MALLTVKERKEYFKELKLGSYTKANIEKLQKRYMLRSSDVDGEYGINTDNLLRHLMSCHLYLDPNNFKPEEFSCGCNGRHCCGYPTYMKPIELKNVQAIRSHYKKPMIITCGLRCSEYNREVGGISNSEHKQGLAVDYCIYGVTDTLANRKQSIKWIQTLPNHHYTYGDGIYAETVNGRTSTGYVSSPGMGNALHTDSRESAQPVTSDGKLVVDGVGGAATVKAMQRFFGVGQDGVISGQNLSLKKYYPALTAVSGGSTGSATIRNLQRWVGTSEDGVLGPATVKVWQKKIGVNADGIFGTNSMKAWQKYLNTHEKAVYPKRTGTKVIDISEFQNTINFAKVKADGIKGVIIRCGYRGAEKGTLNEDARFIEHINGAYKAGLAVGIYMFTEGITAKEGREEATYAVKLWKKAGIPLSYPIAVDTEDVFYYKNGKRCAGRANGLSRAKRTEVIKAFCEEIKSQGYEPMIYASTSWLNNKLDMSKLPYKVWVAQYNSVCEYKGAYVMWQYTSTAQVDGISGNVDMNKCYITAKEYGPPRNKTPQDKMLAWAKKIADETKYHYVRWIEGVAKTHTCPICTGRKYDDAFGGNCIWFAWASWHHGASLPCKCSCSVFTDYHYNQLLKLGYTDASKLARQRIGLEDVYLMRSYTSLSLDQLKAGDIIAYFNNSGYVHTALYIGNGQIADCTSSRSDGIKYGVPSYTNWSIKLAFRYTGK